MDAAVCKKSGFGLKLLENHRYRVGLETISLVFIESLRSILKLVTFYLLTGRTYKYRIPSLLSILCPIYCYLNYVVYLACSRSNYLVSVFAIIHY